jgi:hypothetical protein
MPALNFVAIESGLEDDPKLLSLAKVLGVRREVAFWYVYRWRVLIVQQGMHLTGSLPKKYTAQDIAAFVEFRGVPHRLINAMKTAGFLGCKSGGFFYPGWKDTVTGDFAADREDDRLRKRREREERRGRPPVVLDRAPDVPGTSTDASLDRARMSDGNPEERNETSEVGSPPGPPRSGGSSLADERWEWLFLNAPTPQNPAHCKKLLAAMPESEWALVVRAYGRGLEGSSSLSKKERRDLRVLNWATDKFLREQAYLRFAVIDRPRKRPPPALDPSTHVTAADQLKQRLASSDDFVMELLRDPEQSDRAKAEAKRRWWAVPENADRSAPWEKHGNRASQNGVAT